MALRQSTMLARLGLQQALRAASSGAGQQFAARGFAAAAGKSSGSVSFLRHFRCRHLALSCQQQRRNWHGMLTNTTLRSLGAPDKPNSNQQRFLDVSSSTTCSRECNALHVFSVVAMCREVSLRALLHWLLASGVPRSLATSTLGGKRVSACLKSR